MLSNFGKVYFVILIMIILREDKVERENISKYLLNIILMKKELLDIGNYRRGR